MRDAALLARAAVVAGGATVVRFRQNRGPAHDHRAVRPFLNDLLEVALAAVHLHLG